MIENKYGKVLTVILVIVVIGVLILLGFLGYDVYKKYTSDKTVAEVMDEFEETVTGNSNQESTEVVENPEISVGNLQINNVTTSGESSSGSSNVVQYEGYNVVGKIEIPAIDLEYPILEKTTPDSIELSVEILYTANGLNQPGNSVIIGHNYRNNLFFSNNDKIKKGDSVYIKDKTGVERKYKVTDTFETSASDADFYKPKDVNKTTVVLSTCTDDASTTNKRWIVMAELEG